MALVECNHKFHFLLGNKIMWLMLIKCGGKKKRMMNMCRSRHRMEGRGENMRGEENLVHGIY
jgi:hypothetical protein